MKDEIEYTIADVLASEKKSEEFRIPFKGERGEGIVRFKIKPLTYGELKLLMRKAGGDELGAADEMIRMAVRQIVKDKDGNDSERAFSEGDLERLPPGIVLKLAAEVNRLSGFGAEVGGIKNW